MGQKEHNNDQPPFPIVKNSVKRHPHVIQNQKYDAIRIMMLRCEISIDVWDDYE